ncbi:MAG: hypothetical protein ACFE9C_03220 [Candidatus Hodarchaeota archaeon]
MELNKNSIKKVVRIIIKSFLVLFYAIFIGSLIIGGLTSGIITLIPDEASKLCYLGYYAHCSFTPYSTLILFAMTIIGTILLLKFIKYVRKQYNQFKEAKSAIKARIIN